MPDDLTTRTDDVLAAIDGALGWSLNDGHPEVWDEETEAWETEAMRWSPGHLDAAEERRAEAPTARVIAEDDVDVSGYVPWVLTTQAQRDAVRMFMRGDVTLSWPRVSSGPDARSAVAAAAEWGRLVRDARERVDGGYTRGGWVQSPRVPERMPVPPVLPVHVDLTALREAIQGQLDGVREAAAEAARVLQRIQTSWTPEYSSPVADLRAAVARMREEGLAAWNRPNLPGPFQRPPRMSRGDHDLPGVVDVRMPRPLSPEAMRALYNQASVVEPWPAEPTETETVAERALRLRRERNTGPQSTPYARRGRR